MSKMINEATICLSLESEVGRLHETAELSARTARLVVEDTATLFLQCSATLGEGDILDSLALEEPAQEVCEGEPANKNERQQSLWHSRPSRKCGSTFLLADTMQQLAAPGVVAMFADHISSWLPTDVQLVKQILMWRKIFDLNSKVVAFHSRGANIVESVCKRRTRMTLRSRRG